MNRDTIEQAYEEAEREVTEARSELWDATMNASGSLRNRIARRRNARAWVGGAERRLAIWLTRWRSVDGENP